MNACTQFPLLHVICTVVPFEHVWLTTPSIVAEPLNVSFIQLPEEPVKLNKSVLYELEYHTSESFVTVLSLFILHMFVTQ